MEVATAALGLNVFRGVAAVKPYHMGYSKYTQGQGSQGGASDYKSWRGCTPRGASGPGSTRS